MSQSKIEAEIKNKFLKSKTISWLVAKLSTSIPFLSMTG